MQRFVYTLIDPRDGAIRYVGLSASGIGRLYRQISRHFRRDKTHRALWLASLAAAGLKPKWNIVEVCATDEEVSAAERFWIRRLRELGHDLTNHMDGGFDGRPDEATRQRMREVHLKTHCENGHEYTPESTGVGHKVGTRYCKTCRGKWLADHRAQLREHGRSYYVANREELKAASNRRYHTRKVA